MSGSQGLQDLLGERREGPNKLNTSLGGATKLRYTEVTRLQCWVWRHRPRNSEFGHKGTRTNNRPPVAGGEMAGGCWGQEGQSKQQEAEKRVVGRNSGSEQEQGMLRIFQNTRAKACEDPDV